LSTILFFTSFEYEDVFLYRFASKIDFSNLSTGNITSSLKAWRGFFIKNSHLGDQWLNNLWFGIVINSQKWNKDNTLEYELILQICSKELAPNFSGREVLPNYGDYTGYNEGIIVKPDSEGKYFLESTWLQCKDFITQYSLLGSEGHC
jgi:hypothetical protein